MEFTRELFYKRIHKEVRRKPRHIGLREWSYYHNSDIGLVAEEVLSIYTGKPSEFDDLMHFYFQTIRVELEAADGIDWKTQLEQKYRDRQLIISTELRERPWQLTILEAETFESLYERISAALPDTAVFSSFCEGILMGEASWEETHVLARFDQLLIRIELVNLA